MRNVVWEWVLGGDVEAIATPGRGLDATSEWTDSGCR